MGKLGGYTGSILKVDLTTRSITSTPLSLDLAARFIGGAGINAWLAYHHVEPSVSPFSPGNALVLGAGPLVGTLAPGAGKSNITAKSTASPFIGWSGSGHMGMLKFAGHDHLIVTGKAESPVYLEIGDEIRIREAGHLWGKDTWEATDAIWRELSRKYAVACIGPAGENLVRNASVIANKYSAYALTGMGAVMGSKKLKAIAAYGSHGISIADPKRFTKLVNQVSREIMSLPIVDGFRTYGTLVLFESLMKRVIGAVTYKNFQWVLDVEDAKSFGFDPKLFSQMLAQHGTVACLGCPVGCKHFLRLEDEGPHPGLTMTLSCAGVPFEHFGGLCAVKGWPAVLKCAELCNRLGMDEIATSGIIAMAIELYERGIIGKKDTGGLVLDWQADVVQELIQRIAHRQGFGNILADGLIEAPRQLGRGADDYAIRYKGLSGCCFDPRAAFTTWVVSSLTSPAGRWGGQDTVAETAGGSVDKMRSRVRQLGMSEEDMERVFSGPEGYNLVRLTKWTEDYAFVLECLGLCTWGTFQAIGINAWAEIYSAATGIEMDGAALLKAAARGHDVRQAFNMREGASRKDNVMHRRFLTEPLKPLNIRNEICPPVDSTYVERVITEYYEERGWDPQEGTLTPERLAEVTNYSKKRKE